MGKKFFVFLFSISTISCTSPVAPTQPETGIITNYTERGRKISRFGFLSNNHSKVATANDGTISIRNLPFFKQGKDNTCGQASMAMVLNYWGVEVDYQTIINESNPGNFPTDSEVITGYLRNKGMSVTPYKRATIDYVKSLVAEGKPPIVLLDFGGLSNEHYVVVSGFNDQRGFMVVSDPINGPNTKIEYKQFERMWENKSLANLLIFGDKYYKPVFDISG